MRPSLTQLPAFLAAAPPTSLSTSLRVPLSSFSTTSRPIGHAFRTRRVIRSTSMSTSDPLVQYVAVRSDLDWPSGSLMAQAVHASLSAIWISRDTSETQSYCSQPGNLSSHTNTSIQPQMHTVVLSAKSEQVLLAIATSLKDAGLIATTWREQPEDIVTAVAAAPYARSVVKPHFAKLRLFK